MREIAALREGADEAAHIPSQLRSLADPLPQRLTLDGERRHLVEIGREPQAAAERFPEPMPQRGRDPRNQRHHGLAIEGAVRLGVGRFSYVRDKVRLLYV
jgi:hypothetical protein